MAQKPDRRPALGRGLSALIPEKPAAPVAPAAAPVDHKQPQREVDLDLIDPNPLQPRTRFDETRLQELAESISSTGLVQPIVVRRKGERFEIVAGERRWRAAQIAGLLKLPVHVSDVSDEKLLQTALIENIQREDLNAIEEALAYKRLGDESGMTQEEIAAAVGKDRATVANHLRLLKLPEQVRVRVANGELSMGHARALLTVEDPVRAAELARQAVKEGWSVRDVEREARSSSERPPKRASTPPPAPSREPVVRALEEALRERLATRVLVRLSKQGTGTIEVPFTGSEDFERIFALLTGREASEIVG